MTDREKLIGLLLEIDSVCDGSDCCECCEEGCYTYRAADHLITNGVTVQQKGHWKYYSTGFRDYSQCSVCKGGVMRGIKYPYCPWCGAKMEE